MAFLRSVSFPSEHSWSVERGGFQLRLLARKPSSEQAFAGDAALPSIRASGTDSEINGNRSEQAQTGNQGGGSHMLPSSRLHYPVNARLKMADSAVLREKTIFSPRNASVSEWTLSRILKIKISHDTKQLFRKPSLPRMRRLLSLLFSIILFFLLTFFSRCLFLLTISRPPRGYVRTKKVLHTLRTANSRDWILQSYRFRRSGRTVDTACAGLRAGPANLRCRLLSSVLLFSSRDLRIQSGITRTRISSWTVTPLFLAISFNLKKIRRSRTCVNFTDSLPSRTCEPSRIMTTRSRYTWLTYSS